MVSFTKLLRYAERRLAVLAQEAQEVVSGDKIGLRGFDNLSREFVRLPGNGGRQAQDLSRLRHS
jgi:hypothetical protein